MRWLLLLTFVSLVRGSWQEMEEEMLRAQRLGSEYLEQKSLGLKLFEGVSRRFEGLLLASEAARSLDRQQGHEPPAGGTGDVAHGRAAGEVQPLQAGPTADEPAALGGRRGLEGLEVDCT